MLFVGFYDVYYNCVCCVCVLIKKDFDDVFVIGVDVILMLVILFVVFGFGEMVDVDLV